MLYRIYTEDIPGNRAEIERTVTLQFPGFTITKGEGFWRAQKENSLIIEIVLPDETDEQIKLLASQIKLVNKQEAVLVQKIRNEQWII